MTLAGINRRSLLTFGALGLAVGCKPSDTVSGSGKDPDKTKDKSAPRDGVVVNELQLDYSIVLANGETGMPVNEQFAFRNGDRFKFRVRPAFEAHVYILNRGPRQKEYSFLYPHKAIKQENPVPAKSTVEIPGSSADWLQMDKTSGTEQIVLIASPSALVEFNVPATSIERDEFEERLGRVERDYRPASSRRLEDGGWVSLLASRGAKTAMVVRLPLDHRA
jgi:Domain of unknown function (DUF4384)